MKKLIIGLTAIGVLLGVSFSAQAGPRQDLKAYQNYFKKRFPHTPFKEFSNGINGLPTGKAHRKEWEEMQEFPPYDFNLDKGKAFWDKNNLGSCFKNGGVGIAQNYPYWDKKDHTLHTAVEDVNNCLVKLGKKPIKNLKTGTMANVVAYFKNMSRGKRMKVDVDFSDPKALKLYEYGKHFFWAKRGQLNFSCADCHLYHAGDQIGGNILSASLGHGMDAPMYRKKWGDLGTMHRRYAGCNKQVRAKPFKPQSREYKALQLYEFYMDTGLPLEAPNSRE